MQVPSATATTRTASASDTTGASTPITAAKKAALGQDDFLKLLAVQFQQQDPMKPMEDTAFIAQMAQFTSLDQTKTLVQQMTQLSSSQDISTANTFIGRQVTLDNGDGLPVTGQVSGVDITDGTPRLIIGDKTYPISSVLLVEPGTATATPTSSPVTPAGV